MNFRFWESIILLVIVFPVCILYRVKDFLILTVIQIIVIWTVITSVIICNVCTLETQGNQFETDIKMFSTNFKDYLLAFPFVIFAFGCQPWVLLIHEGIVNQNHDEGSVKKK